MNQDNKYFQYNSDFQKEKKALIELVKYSYGDIGLLSQYDIVFYDDNEVILNAVKINGCALGYASPRLRSNRNIVLEAVKNDGLAIKYANPSFYYDEEIISIVFKNVSTREFEGEMGGYYYGKVYENYEYFYSAPSIGRRINKKIEKENVEPVALVDKFFQKIFSPFFYFDKFEIENRRNEKLKKQKEEIKWQIKYKEYKERWQQ